MGPIMMAEFLSGAWSGKRKGWQSSFWLTDSYTRELSLDQLPITMMDALTLRTQWSSMSLTDNRNPALLINPNPGARPKPLTFMSVTKLHGEDQLRTASLPLSIEWNALQITPNDNRGNSCIILRLTAQFFYERKCLRATLLLVRDNSLQEQSWAEGENIP